MKKIYLYISILLFFLLFSYCINNKKKVFYKNGKIKEQYLLINNKIDGEKIEYYESGKFKSITNWKDSILEGKCKYYYENGKIKENGHYYNGKRIGDWQYFDMNNKLSIKRTYVIVQGLSHLNQVFYYDANGNIIDKKSNYYLIKVKHDTIIDGSPYVAKINLIGSILKNKMIIIFVDYDKDFLFPNDLKNIEKFDTLETYSGNISFETQKYIIGKNYLKGIILDYKSFNKNDSIVQNKARIMFFNKEFYVNKLSAQKRI